MDNQEEIKKVIDGLMASDTLESPSFDFTKKVIQKVNSVKSKEFEYKPLLPKWVLSLTSVLLIGILVYGLSLADPSENSIPYLQDWNKIGGWTSDFFAQFNVTKTMVYSIAISGTMLGFYTLVLKKHFENRLA